MLELKNGDIASGSLDKSIIITRFIGQEVTYYRLINHTDRITSMIELKNGNLATGSQDMTITVWNLNDKQPKYKLIGHKSTVESLDLLPNKSNELISASSDGNIIVWDLRGAIIKYTINIAYTILTIKSFPDSESILVGTTNGKIIIINLKNKMIEYMLSEEIGKIRSIVLLEDNLIASSNGKNINIWNLNDRHKIYQLRGHKEDIFSLFLLSNGYLASGSFDNSIRIWNLENGKSELQLFDNQTKLSCLLALKNGILLSGGYDNLIVIWRLF